MRKTRDSLADLWGLKRDSFIDKTEVVLLIGHNIPYLHTPLVNLPSEHNSAIPKIIIIDPVRTLLTARATVHLALKPETHVAVMNGLLNLIIQSGYADERYLKRSTVGFFDLRKEVSRFTPHTVGQISEVPARMLMRAANIIGCARSMMSMVFHGETMSNHSTAAAILANNLMLIRGFNGKEGCGIYKLNDPMAPARRDIFDNGNIRVPGVSNIKKPVRMWKVEPN